MVIQRWQSLLLLVAAAVMGCFSFCSLGQIQTADFTYNFTSMGFYQEGIPTNGVSAQIFHTWYLFAVTFTSMLLLLIDIFLFKNLPLQKKVCLVSLLFIIASSATVAYLGYQSFSWWRNWLVFSNYLSVDSYCSNNLSIRIDAERS